MIAMAALAVMSCATPGRLESRAPTILVSIDGFRPDYLERGVTPNLNALAADGAVGEMRPSFPSKTFPNHHTLVTGRRPDRHGMVDNTMEDPQIPGVRFRLANAEAMTDPRWWNEAAPIWVTAERAGVRTATMFWPGSETAIRGTRPSQWRKYDETVTPSQRVDQVLAWLDAPAPERPQFLTLYFEQVDDAGHDHGPDSAQVNAAAAEIDRMIGRLVSGLQARGLAANLVIVSDHGMAAVSPERRIFLDDLIAPSNVTTMTMGAFMSAYPKPGREQEVDAALIRPHPHMQCWRKAEIPAQFAYGRHRRVPPYFCLPNTGWEITTRAYVARQKPQDIDYGNHGFDPNDPTMRAAFIAAGPAFRRGVRVPVFDNVDVYPLLARLIGVRPEPNEGDLVEIRQVLVR